jgi:hypothetical protein
MPNQSGIDLGSDVIVTLTDVQTLTNKTIDGSLYAGSVLTGTLPVGVIPSLTAYIPQGVIPSGSLTNALPQGVLPVGSIPSLTAYIPQGQLITGSLPNNITVSGNIVGTNGSYTGSMMALGFSGSLNAGSIFAGTISDSRLPSSMTGKTFTSDVLGLTIGQQVHGSFTGSLSAGSLFSHGNIKASGSVYGYGGTLSGVTASPGGTQYAIQYNDGASLAGTAGSLSWNGSEMRVWGSFTVSTNGTSETLPAIMGFGDFSAGEAGLLQFGDAANGMLVAYGSDLNIYSYHPTVLAGGRGVVSVPSFFGSTNNYHTVALQTQNSKPGFMIRGAAAPVTPLLQFENGAKATVAAVYAGGDGSFIGSLRVGSLYSAGNVNIGGSYYGWGGTLTGVTASATPAGSNTAIQFNDGGTGSGDSRFTWDKSDSQLQVVGSIIVQSGSQFPLIVLKNSAGSTVNSLTSDGKFRFGTGNAFIGSADGFPDRMRLDGGATTIEFGNFSEIYFAESLAELELYNAGVGSINIRNQGGGTANLRVQNNVIAKTMTFESEYDNGNSGASKTLDWNNSQKQKITMTGNCAFTFTNPTYGVGNFQLRVIGDGTPRTPSYPGNVVFPNGITPTITGTSGKWDIISFFFDGGSYSAVHTGSFG